MTAATASKIPVQLPLAFRPLTIGDRIPKTITDRLVKLRADLATLHTREEQLEAELLKAVADGAHFTDPTAFVEQPGTKLQLTLKSLREAGFDSDAIAAKLPRPVSGNPHVRFRAKDQQPSCDCDELSKKHLIARPVKGHFSDCASGTK